MSSSISYPTVEQIIEKHDLVITESGGFHGLRDYDGLCSAIEFIQNDLYYPEFYSKLCHLIFSINKNHFFADGNKRTSLSAGAMFLLTNGFQTEYVDWYLLLFEDFVVWLADNKVNKEDLTSAIRGVLIRIGMIEKALSPKTNREVKLAVKRRLDSHESLLKNPKINEIGYIDSPDFYNAEMMRRIFFGLNFK